MSTIPSLADIAARPEVLTFNLALPSGEPVRLRPLVPDDVTSLAAFLEGLSEQTRQYWNLDSYGFATAQDHCDAIAKYDKLRFVAISPIQNNIVALLEFSLFIPESDETRFEKYGIRLSPTDCRFGPCLADAYQGQGVGAALFPYMVKVAKTLGKDRIILWGGVFAENQKAIRFYYRAGFQLAGEFMLEGNRKCFDMFLAI